MKEMAMEFALGRAAIALAGTAFLAWQDWKTSFIDERVAYAMIAAGALLNLLTGDFELMKFAFGGAALIFGFGYLLYRTGRLGGGDVLMYTGLQLLLPYNPMLFEGGLGLVTEPLQREVLREIAGRAPFFITVFAASTLAAMVGSTLFYASKLAGLKKLKPDYHETALGIAFWTAGAYAVTAFSAVRLSLAQTAFYAALFLPALFILAFRKQIMDEVVVQKIPLSQVEDEDVLVLHKMPEGIARKYGLQPVLTKSEVEKLKLVQKREKISKFPVAKVLPRLGPYILLALVLGLSGIDLVVLLLLLS